MANVLRGCHSYALIKPNGREKIVVKRGQSIDNLSEEDRNYLASKTITPPMQDDSHPAIGRLPIFMPAVDADVKGEASVEAIATPAAPTQPYAGQAQGQAEVVTVQVQAAPAAAPAAVVADDGAAAGGGDDDGGEDAEEAPAPEARRRKKPQAKAGA
jgi:hypothetical protein